MLGSRAKPSTRASVMSCSDRGSDSTDLNIQVKLRARQTAATPPNARPAPAPAKPGPPDTCPRRASFSISSRGPCVSTSQPSSVITLVSLNATPNLPQPSHCDRVVKDHARFQHGVLVALQESAGVGPVGRKTGTDAVAEISVKTSGRRRRRPVHASLLPRRRCATMPGRRVSPARHLKRRCRRPQPRRTSAEGGPMVSVRICGAV